MSVHPINRIGQTFGRLTVVAYADKRNHAYYWQCQCICGNIVVTKGDRLADGSTRSCGCLARELTRTRTKTHGMTNTREFRAWKSMKDRCTVPSHQAFCNYGGRGIKVCQEWLDSFETFYHDMGQCPPDHQLDRIDNDGNYTSKNCRWATRKQQARNRRSNTHLTHNGKTHTIVEWTELLGLGPTTIYDRLRRGWSVLESLTKSIDSSHIHQ